MGLASIRNVNRYMQAIYTDLKAKRSTPLVLSTDSGGRVQCVVAVSVHSWGPGEPGTIR